MTPKAAVYARFEALEEQVAHFYFLLQEKFIKNPPLAKFWTEAALEELQHASILRYCREHQLFSPAEIDDRDADELTEVVDVVGAIIGDADLTADRAFFAALLIESSGIDKAFRRLAQALAADHYLLHTAIEASLRSHHSAFAAAAETFMRDRTLADGFRELLGNG